jgi:hypothetical protein
VSQRAISGRRRVRKIRYHDDEWSVIGSHARACGLPPATFVRKVSLGATPRARRNRLENELILRLGRIASDLDRLIRIAERTGDFPARSQLDSVMRVSRGTSGDSSSSLSKSQSKLYNVPAYLPKAA